MKKLLVASALLTSLVAGPAMAADLAYKTPSPPPPPALSWSGFYIGVQGGAGWGTTEDNLTALGICNAAGACAGGAINPPGLLRDSYGVNGWHGGGTIGWNWQTGPIVFGVEGDISGANINGNSGCGAGVGVGVGINSACATNMTRFATATGRLGFTVDQALLYVKGGGAWAHFDRTLTSGVLGVGVAGTAFSTPTIGESRQGFAFGAGVEYAFWGNWSAKLEYDYMDFGTKSFAFTTFSPVTLVTVTSTFDDRERVHLVRAGLNYRFNWGPVVAKY
jgi:outer membrane immunogenic protein